MSSYPDYVYTKNIDVTKENKRLYDLKQDKIKSVIAEHYPDYKNLRLGEQYKIRTKVQNELHLY